MDEEVEAAFAPDAAEDEALTEDALEAAAATESAPPPAHARVNVDWNMDVPASAAGAAVGDDMILAEAVSCACLLAR